MNKYIFTVLTFVGISYYFTHFFNVGAVMDFSRKHRHNDITPRVSYAVAMVYYQRSDHVKAEEAFTTLLTEYPTCQYAPKALIRLGLTAYELHHWDGARDAFGKYLEMFPDGKDAKIAEKNYEMAKHR